ncbi:hypothetical protein RF11_12791 [Thelohanellus kitauei]|uniref:Uncharacterized protein n=1 Tax=Thelohanellus kitauei TaxID=669202 RepID=A0A0C2IWY0_THEKT|nr:hypothetical protein RF11_12791 [Thelohanellus kitauei]
MNFLVRPQPKPQLQDESQLPLPVVSGSQPQELPSWFPVVIMEHKGVSYSGLILPRESIEKKQGTTEDFFEYLLNNNKSALKLYKDPKDSSWIRPRQTKGTRNRSGVTRRNSSRNNRNMKLDVRARLDLKQRRQISDATREILLRNQTLHNQLPLLETKTNATNPTDFNFLKLGLVYSFYEANCGERFM